MALTVAVSDNANSSGVTATVTGSGGVPVSVYYQLAQQTSFAPTTWVLAGTLNGDGVLPIALNPGYAFFYAVSGSQVSSVVFSEITTATDSVMFRCLTAVQAQLQTLTLENLPPANIQVRYLPRALEGIDSWPLVCIAPLGQESIAPYMASIDLVQEPITVATIVPQNANYNANMRQCTRWREQIGQRLRHQRLPGVPEMLTLEQLPSSIFDGSAFQHLWFLGLCLFHAKTRQTRGA